MIKLDGIASCRFLVVFTYFILIMSWVGAEEKSFVIVIPSHYPEWYQKSLDSVFCQNYINYRVIYSLDGSNEQENVLVEQYIKQKHQQHRVTLLKNTQVKGVLGCMCQAVFSCEEKEIVLELNGSDWLAHPDVLSQLNQFYADPDVWMTYGQFIYYPSLLKGFASPLPVMIIENNEVRSCKGYVTHLKTFYASLFQAILKEDFLDEGMFFPRAGDLAYVIPMLEMAGSHSRFIPNIMYVFNYSDTLISEKKPSDLECLIDQKIRKKPKYQPLEELPSNIARLMSDPQGVYQKISNLFDPTIQDYQLLQEWLYNGKRENLDRLGDMSSVIRNMKIIGNLMHEFPLEGSIHVNCHDSDRENCILVYSSFNRNYPKGFQRLLKAIIESNFKGHVLYRLGGWPNIDGGSLMVSHVPYAFKPSFFQEARKRGFKKVLWLDVAVVPIADLNDIFSRIQEKGYFVMGNQPHTIGRFMNEKAAVYFGLTHAQTNQIPSCSAGLFGVDFTQKIGALLIDQWYRAAFDPDVFFSPRSDQNVLSMLLDQSHLKDLTDIHLMPHAETNDLIQPNSLFYLDRLYIR